MSSFALAARPLEFYIAQYRRVWRGTAISTVVTPIVYLLALGVGLGVFADRFADLPAGVTYLEFVAPGLLAATAMQLASFEASWPVLSAIKWSRQYHAMLATPLRIGDIVLGHQAFIAARMFMTATVYLVVIAILMPFLDSSISPLAVLAIPVTVLVGIAYAAPLAAWGAHTENEASFVAIFRFVILPMFLFSGTFFPISELPRVLEAIAYLTPLWHGVDLCRQLMLGDVILTSAIAHVVYLLAWIVIGLTLAFITYRRRLVV